MENNHYYVADRKENGVKNDIYEMIPLNKIIFDKGMVAIANEKCDDICKNKNIKKFKTGELIPMKKWDKVYHDFENKKPLDPVKVKRFKTTEYYEIIDGRHRCILSHYSGFTHIPCLKFEEL